MSKCKQCNHKFGKDESSIIINLKRFCDYDCATKFGKENIKKGKVKKEREERKVTRERKKELRPKSWYVKEAQKWFNKYIRLRDAKESCICCDRPPTNEIQWHAGHFLTTGARPEHRFNEDNCHKQTSYCNNHLSGNVAEYRKRLIEKIGLERVECLESDHKPKNYTIKDLELIIVKYKVKCKELEK